MTNPEPNSNVADDAVLPAGEPVRLLLRAPVVAAVVAFWVFLPSLGGYFLYDDFSVVLTNRWIRDLASLRTVLLYEPSRPLLNLTWALNYAWGGLDPYGYHLVNVLIHAANAALVASLFGWMALRSGSIRTLLGGPVDVRRAALFGGCLFAINPMAVETVTYVSSRSTALCTFFVLASLRLAVSHFDRASGWRLAAALTACVLALATKEEAVALPLLLLLLDFFFVAGQSGRRLLARWRVHAGFLLPPILGVLARRAVTGTWLPPAAISHGIYALTQFAAFPRYFLRCALPVDPAFYRDEPPSSWPPDTVTLLWCVGTIVLVIAALGLRRRWPLLLFATAWLLAGLLPSSSILPLREMVVDHRAYLGGMGVSYIVAVALSARQFWLLRGLLVVVLGVRCLMYQSVMVDPVNAWMDATDRVPRSAEAWRMLGEGLASRDDPRALSALTKAIKLAPDDARNWSELGAYYVTIDRFKEAIQAMQKAVSLAPREPRLRDNLGSLLARQGHLELAVAQFLAAIRADPRIARPRINLAAVALRMGDQKACARLLDEVVQARLELDEEDVGAIEHLRKAASH